MSVQREMTWLVKPLDFIYSNLKKFASADTSSYLENNLLSPGGRGGR